MASPLYARIPLMQAREIGGDEGGYRLESRREEAGRHLQELLDDIGFDLVGEPPDSPLHDLQERVRKIRQRLLRPKEQW